MPGGMGGGQTQTSNSMQVQSREPWGPAIPGLNRALTDADTLYTAGVGGQVYGGQRAADFSQDQSAGIQSVRDQAASDNAGGIGTSFLQNALGSYGISPTTQQGLGMLAAVPNADTSKLSALADRIGSGSNPINQTANAFMSGARDPTTEGDLRGLLGRALAPSAAEQNLAGVARGDFLDPTTNPFVQALVKNANQNASNATKEAYAASGRYGSGNFAGAMTKAISDVDTNLYANQYNQERANQFSANSQIDAARQAGTTLGSGIVNAISGVQGTNNAQRLQGAQLGQAQQSAEAGVRGQVLGGDQFNSSLGVQKAQGFIGAGQQGMSAALQAAGLLPSVDALRYAPANNLLQVGGLQQQREQAALDEKRDYFDDTQTVPWQALGQYAAFPTSIGSMGGTTTTVGTEKKQTSGQNPLQTILGLGTGLLSLGTGGGSTLGGGLLGGMFGSDERLKEDIHPVGELKDGQPIYSYRYRGDPRVQIGLLAHEVAEKRPDAVGPIGLGDLLGVDYGRATADAARLAAKDGRADGGKGGKGPKKGSGGPGGSAPAAPPTGLMQAALEALREPPSGGAPGEHPRLTIVMGGAPHGADVAPAGLGGLIAAALDGRGPGASTPSGPGSLADAMRALMPVEAAPLRREPPQPPARGRRRAAA